MEKDSNPRVRDLFVWQALSHPTIAYPKGTFLSLGGLVIFLTTILVLFQEWLAIGVTWAAYFLFFVLSRVPQTTVEHKITTEGLISLGHTYLWLALGPFWFTKKGAETILHVASRGLFDHLVILVDEKDQEKIKEILAEYLPFVEVPEKSGWEKISEKFSASDRS